MKLKSDRESDRQPDRKTFIQTKLLLLCLTQSNIRMLNGGVFVVRRLNFVHGFLMCSCYFWWIWGVSRAWWMSPTLGVFVPLFRFNKAGLKTFFFDSWLTGWQPPLLLAIVLRCVCLTGCFRRCRHSTNILGHKHHQHHHHHHHQQRCINKQTIKHFFNQGVCTRHTALLLQNSWLAELCWLHLLHEN